MNVAVTARTAGRVTLNVIGDRLISSTSPGRAGRARSSMRVPVGRDWGNGAYVVATLRRPLDAHGAAHAGPRHRRAMVLDRPQGANARGRHEPAAAAAAEHDAARAVKVDGLAAGEEARIVVAAVDVGILNLTNYKPPAPDDYYLGQRRLTAEIRDLYGQLIDGMQGTRGQIRTGGDAGGELDGSPPSQAPLALYSGIVTVEPDGTAEVRVRHPGLCRHRARDGGGLEQGQGRQGVGRRHRARSGRADRDAAALPAAPATAAPCISISTTSKVAAGDYSCRGQPPTAAAVCGNQATQTAAACAPSSATA